MVTSQDLFRSCLTCSEKLMVENIVPPFPESAPAPPAQEFLYTSHLLPAPSPLVPKGSLQALSL